MIARAVDPELRVFRDKLEAAKSVELPVWQKRSLTIDEASAYTGIGKTTLYKLCKKVGLKIAIFDGFRILIKRKEFERYINSMRTIKED